MRDGSIRLAELAAQIAVCDRCHELANSRTRAVPGRGGEHARIMIVAPHPSEEDERAEAPAGTSLLQWLSEHLPMLGDERTETRYVTAVLKCVPRSEGTVRAALDHEQTNCYPFLSAEISVITPHFVLPVGRETSAFVLRKLFGRAAGSVLPPSIRVVRSPAFRVVPVAGPNDLEVLAARERTRYLEQLRALATRIGL